MDVGFDGGLSAGNAAAPALFTGDVLAGCYRMLGMLGEGGMGSVYKSEQIKMNRLTAIKILKPELARSSEFVARFAREAEMASRIDHPHAVAIYDFGEADSGVVYLAMEFLDGEPLSALIRREGPQPLGRVVRIASQAAEALDAAHRLGIIHRDFKPDNVMLCRKPGETDWVKVVDFGIAKQTQDAGASLTRTGHVVGTPAYMSPEQVTGETLDARSDVYSLALVVYNLLTGELPFTGSTPQSLMVNRLLELPRPLRELRPELSPEVDAAVMTALAREREGRFRSGSAFARALQEAAKPSRIPRAVKAEVMKAKPVSRVYAERKQASVKPPRVLPDEPVSRSAAQPDLLEQKIVAPNAATRPASRRRRTIAIVTTGALALTLGVAALAVVKLRHGDPSPAGPVSITATASSTRAPMSDNSYEPASVLDDQLQTAWLEGATGPGLGQWLQCTFSREVTLHRIRIAPGYFKSPEVWARNNRLAAATFVFSSGDERKFRFPDRMEEQTIDVGTVHTRWVRVVINEVYFGADADTAISQLSFEYE